MSKADELYRQTCLDILNNGFYDTDLEVRPHWEDGTPAHTVKKFGVVNRYDLRKEFPVMTLRRTYFKSCVDELLWIWQKKSNDTHELGSKIWDAWADENGTIVVQENSTGPSNYDLAREIWYEGEPMPEGWQS